MAKTPQQSYLQSFGLPSVSRQTTIDQRRKGLLQGAADTGSGAGFLGALLGNALAPQGLTAEEEAQHAIKDRADAEFTTILQSTEYASASPEQKRFAYQDSLARATAETNPALASEMFNRNLQEKQQYLKSQGELEKLGLETAGKRQGLAIAAGNYSMSQSQQWQPYAVVGADGKIDVSKSVLAKKTPNGQLVDEKGNVLTGAQPFEKAAARADELKKYQIESLGGSISDRKQAFLKGSVKQVQQAKDFTAASYKAAGVIQRVGEQFLQAKADGVDPEQFLGIAGKATSVIINTVTAAAGGSKTFRNTATVDEDGNVVETLTEKLVPNSEAMAYLSDIGVDNAKIRANVIELAFSVARMQEPGGRLSDNDFKVALTRIGGDYSDPRALSATLQQLMQGNQEEYTFRVKGIESDGKTFNLPKGAATEAVYGEQHDLLMGRYVDIEDTYSELDGWLGTADDTTEADEAAKLEQVTTGIFNKPEAPVTNPTSNWNPAPGSTGTSGGATYKFTN